jgi:hypothetical protein
MNSRPRLLADNAAFSRNPECGAHGNQRFVDSSRRFGLYNHRLITRRSAQVTAESA